MGELSQAAGPDLENRTEVFSLPLSFEGSFQARKGGLDARKGVPTHLRGKIQGCPFQIKVQRALVPYPVPRTLAPDGTTIDSFCRSAVVGDDAQQ